MRATKLGKFCANIDKGYKIICRILKLNKVSVNFILVGDVRYPSFLALKSWAAAVIDFSLSIWDITIKHKTAQSIDLHKEKKNRVQ